MQLNHAAAFLALRPGSGQRRGHLAFHGNSQGYNERRQDGKGHQPDAGDSHNRPPDGPCPGRLDVGPCKLARHILVSCALRAVRHAWGFLPCGDGPQKQNRLDCRNFCKNGRGFGQKRIFKALAVVFRNVNALYVLSGNILFYLSGRFWRFGAGIQPVFRLQCLFLAYGAAIPFVFAAAFAQEHGNLRPSRVNERGGNYAACPGRQGALVFRPALCANMLLRKRAPSTLHHADDAVNKRGQRHCRLANQLRRPAFRQSFDVHRLACNLAQSNTCGRLHCRHRFGDMPCLLAENQKRLLISGKR